MCSFYQAAVEHVLENCAIKDIPVSDTDITPHANKYPRDLSYFNTSELKVEIKRLSIIALL